MLFATWLMLVDQISVISVALGLVGVVLATLLFERLLLPAPGRRSLLDMWERTLALSRVLLLFSIEAFWASGKLAIIALKPKARFKPGVVRVPTTLSNQSAIIVLANLISLSPGTLTLDFDSEERCYYIHCIDVGDLHGGGDGRELIERFEEPLRRVFE